jgi:hypothetical protein
MILAPRTSISSACAFAVLCSAAADRYREHAGGVVGHHGCNGSDAGSQISRYGVVAQVGRRALLMVNALPVLLPWRSSLMMACAVGAIAGTFSTRITTRPLRLTVRMLGTTVFAVSILPVATPRARSYVLEPIPRIRFSDATPIIGRDAAEAALFRESVERMDRP